MPGPETSGEAGERVPEHNADSFVGIAPRLLVRVNVGTPPPPAIVGKRDRRKYPLKRDRWAGAALLETTTFDHTLKYGPA